VVEDGVLLPCKKRKPMRLVICVYEDSYTVLVGETVGKMRREIGVESEEWVVLQQ